MKTIRESLIKKRNYIGEKKITIEVVIKRNIYYGYNVMYKTVD